MLVNLSARGLRPLGPTSSVPFVVRVVGDPRPNPSSAEQDALLLRDIECPLPAGFRAYLLPAATEAPSSCFMAYCGKKGATLILEVQYLPY